MRTIALMNQKGGVGKTTTTVNLGAALAERGRRVLLIDLDPQAHLTITYGVEPAYGPTLYDVLLGEAGLLQTVRRLDVPVASESGERASAQALPGSRGELHVLPGSLDLAGIESEMAGIEGRQLRLREAMAKLDETYDYALLDCPPSLGLLTINALAVAEEVLIPMQAHFLALQGFAKLLETTQLAGQSINPSLRVTGVVLTMFDAQTRLSNDVVSELQGFFDAARDQHLPWSQALLFGSKIRRNIKLAEAPSFGQSILAYDAQSNGAVDYRALAAELEGDSVPLRHLPPQRSEGEAVREPALVHSTASPSAEDVARKQPPEATPPEVAMPTAAPELTPAERAALRPEIQFVRRIPVEHVIDPSEDIPAEEPVEV